MITYDLTPNVVHALLTNTIQALNQIILVNNNHPSVLATPSVPINEDYCKKNNIPVYCFQRPGGTIIINTGDYQLITAYPEMDIDITYAVRRLHVALENLVNMLNTKYNIDASLSNNDVLINKRYKIIGCSNYEFKTKYDNYQHLYNAVLIHISNEINQELLSNICLEQNPQKIPSGCKDWNIDIKEVIGFLEKQLA